MAFEGSVMVYVDTIKTSASKLKTMSKHSKAYVSILNKDGVCRQCKASVSILSKDEVRRQENYHTHLEEEYDNYRKPPDGANTFRCNNSIVMAQRKHLDDFFYVVELLDAWNVDVSSWKYSRNLESPRVSFPGDDSMVINRRSTASDLPRQLSSATGTTVSRQTVYSGLGHIGLYARRPVRCVPLTATHCRLRLTWSREHALWTPQQWSFVMFSDESRLSLQSDSRQTLIWRAPGTRYLQENTIERHRYGGAGWLVWRGIILGSRTDMHVQSVTMSGHIYRDVILEQHVRLFRGAMGAEFLFMDGNARPHRLNIVNECLQSEDYVFIDPYGLASILTGLKSNRACVGYAWPTNCSPSIPSHLSTGT
ncbi:transposable element Tcb1 transposase [Trichonephila clavipes]|nr:transposable element Tcb1 transposase [Trichonephila clavipes]